MGSSLGEQGESIPSLLEILLHQVPGHSIRTTETWTTEAAPFLLSSLASSRVAGISISIPYLQPGPAIHMQIFLL